MSCNIIHEKCEKSAASDKTLPRNAYLVTYVVEDWAEGNVKPSLWNKQPIKPEKKVKRKRK